MGHQPEPSGVCGVSLGSVPPQFRIPLKIRDITPEAVAARLSWRLRQLIGPGRRWSIDAVSAATDIDRRTLQLYLEGRTCPSLARYYALQRCLGKETGIELATMLGWIPRHMASSVIPESAMVDLRQGISQTLIALAAVAAAPQDGGNPHVQNESAATPEPLALHAAKSFPPLSAEAVRLRFSSRLRKLVGSGRRWSYHDVMQRSEIDQRTIKAYVLGTAAPNLANYKRLLAILGPEISNELDMSMGWLPRTDRIPPETINALDLHQTLARAYRALEHMAERRTASRYVS